MTLESTEKSKFDKTMDATDFTEQIAKLLSSQEVKLHFVEADSANVITTIPLDISSLMMMKNPQVLSTLYILVPLYFIRSSKHKDRRIWNFNCCRSRIAFKGIE